MVSLWGLFLNQFDAHLNTHQSITGVRLRKITEQNLHKCLDLHVSNFSYETWVFNSIHCHFSGFNLFLGTGPDGIMGVSVLRSTPMHTPLNCTCPDYSCVQCRLVYLLMCIYCILYIYTSSPSFTFDSFSAQCNGLEHGWASLWCLFGFSWRLQLSHACWMP